MARPYPQDRASFFRYRHPVSCVEDPLAVASEGFFDIAGGLGPYEWPPEHILSVTPLADVGLKLGDAAVRSPAELAVGQLGEPPLDQVQP